jgi:Ca2+-binding EF-hand superfamily protein
LLQSLQQRKGSAAANKSATKKFELTEEQKQEIREAFDLFDTDGSGMFRQLISNRYSVKS